jgi:photosystem II stability/assembly factor-like uncharacterized protein
MTIAGYENTEFRDIEAFSDMSAIVMGIASPAYILKTTDGGEHWKRVFYDTSAAMFLDAMEFWNDQSGIVIGDPIDGRFFVARTFDGGETWTPLPEQARPVADSGEACFASSGTNIRALKLSEAVFVSGGQLSHLFIRNSKIKLPLLQGLESTGANSIAIKNKKQFLVTGGDFNLKDSSTGTVAYTKDAGKTWQLPATTASGYRSCAEYLGKNRWLLCGLNGTDISTDGGKSFRRIGDIGYHVCRKSKKGNAVYFAGGGGRIGKLIW